MRNFVVATALAAAVCAAGEGRAAELKIGIVQAQAGESRKYQELLAYLAARGVKASFVTAPDYAAAAAMFASGTVDAMFGGSGIAGTMMLKGLADPLVRGVPADGPATYHAVVVAPKGTPPYTGAGAWFDGKRVIFAALASAGEFYFHSVGPSTPRALLKAASHGAAIDALSRGQADAAVVKNHVWRTEAARYPALEQVGEASGENPDGTLIVSRRLDRATAQQVASALVALGPDASAAAAGARAALGISGYVTASEKDFVSTLALLKRAGVTKDFAFKF
jgi:ABC-type phosphate/phosphonate transport system substrate-binding protein